MASFGGGTARFPTPKVKASKPGVPSAPRTFPGVKAPKRSATSKSATPGRLRAAPKGTPLTPNA